MDHSRFLYAALLPSGPKSSGLAHIRKKEPYDEVFIRYYPSKNIFLNLFARFKFGLSLLIKSTAFRKVVLRYPYSDPLLLIQLKLIGSKLIFEHHGKELLGPKYVKFNFRRIFEKRLRPIIERSTICRICVTEDVAYYQNLISKKSTLIYPNPIITNSSVDLTHYQNYSIKRRYSACFVSSEFRPWHGFHKAINIFELLKDFEFVVVGKIRDLSLSNFPSNVIHYDYLSPSELIELYNSCDCGIGSVGELKSVYTEFASLKTRDYLSNGLPVFLSFPDPLLTPSYCSRYLLDNIYIGPLTRNSLLDFLDKSIQADRGLMRDEFLKAVTNAVQSFNSALRK